MAQIHVQLPRMGESVSEATVVKWLKQPGDWVEEDEPILEIATDKVDSDVPSPISGVLTEQRCVVDQVVQVGETVAIIETEDEAEEQEEVEATPVFEADPEIVNEELSAVDDSAEGHQIPGLDQLTKETKSASGRFYSPLVKNIATQEGISPEELDQIPGSGSEGRVTKQDILAYVEHREGAATATTGEPHQSPTPLTPPTAEPPGRPTSVAPAPPVIPAPGDEIIEMDRMRRLIADHMVRSVHTSPHVCSFVEADVTNLVLWRNKVKGTFEKREGEKITFTPIFIEAVSKAIKDFPMINISVDGTRIIKKRDINIGMATALPSGNLIVPVIKRADQLSLVGLTKAVNDLANRARNNKLQPDDTQGGTFTLTNIGAFGNIMGTPIINQPQVAILAVGTIKKKPAVIETVHGDLIGVRHMMYLSLSYDHRVVDGALGGMFVKRVADYLENWDADREV